MVSSYPQINLAKTEKRQFLIFYGGKKKKIFQKKKKKERERKEKPSISSVVQVENLSIILIASLLLSLPCPL